MSISREIRKALLAGEKPKELVGKGYARSTVYYVARKMREGQYGGWEMAIIRVAEQARSADRWARFTYLMLLTAIDAILGYLEVARVKSDISFEERADLVKEEILEDTRQLYRRVFGEGPPV